MEKTNKIFQNSDNEQQTNVFTSSRDGLREVFRALDLREIVQIVLDDGRKIVKAAPGSERIGSIMLLIEPRCVEANDWLGGLGAFNGSGAIPPSHQTEYYFCEPVDKSSGHRLWGPYGLGPTDCRAELMMRLAYVELLSQRQIYKGNARSRKELNIIRAQCAPKSGYSTHKGAITFNVYYQCQNILHFGIGFAGMLDKNSNWMDDCEYECTCKILRNLWKYLEQAIRPSCASEYSHPASLIACTTEGIIRRLEDL